MYPKPLHDLAGFAIRCIASGQTSTILGAEDKTVAWGPSPVCGELGFGEEAKSSTKPKFVDDLSGARCLDVAMGAWTSLVLLDTTSQDGLGAVGAALAGRTTGGAAKVQPRPVHDPQEPAAGAGGSGAGGGSGGGGGSGSSAKAGGAKAAGAKRGAPKEEGASAAGAKKVRGKK